MTQAQLQKMAAGFSMLCVMSRRYAVHFKFLVGDSVNLCQHTKVHRTSNLE